MKKGAGLEKDGVMRIAEFMAVSARTAPKTRGLDNIETVLVTERRELEAIAKKMTAISAKENRPSFDRDAVSLEDSPVIIIIGVRYNPAGLNCGFCGYKTCGAMKKAKGICAYNSIDLGIASAAAAGIAGEFHADNRIMYSIGRAALDLKLFSPEVKQALGIPLSATGKNPFFDRE